MFLTRSADSEKQDSLRKKGKFSELLSEELNEGGYDGQLVAIDPDRNRRETPSIETDESDDDYYDGESSDSHYDNEPNERYYSNYTTSNGNDNSSFQIGKGNHIESKGDRNKYSQHSDKNQGIRSSRHSIHEDPTPTLKLMVAVVLAAVCIWLSRCVLIYKQ
ncbi:hypothetical protein F5Y13DRAFT_87284 [Hypoxylon sp. FL1857]|nr:hypothetical protein F5Y13DRAFT_87284 [Hypoxylon sp. FL1857]